MQNIRDMRERQAMVIAQLHEQGEQLSKAVEQLVELLAHANKGQDSEAEKMSDASSLHEQS